MFYRLPESSKPESFRGAVGKFNFSASLDKSRTKTNEPISLKFNISGTGNIKLLELPPFELPSGFEKYDPKTEEQINRSGRISGVKKAEYLLIPRIAGTREIPAIDFSYFDPEKKSYQTIKSKSFNLVIEQGQSGNVELSNQHSIEQLESDIRYIKTNYGDLEKQNTILILQTRILGCNYSPVAGGFCFNRLEAKTG